MKVTKAFLLSALMSVVTVVAAGCAAGSPLGLASLQTTSFLKPANSFVPPATQDSQAAYTAAATSRARSPATSPLITLGANDDFRDILNNATGVVLVDFYADWCGPCRRQGGILHDMEQAASQSQATIVKVNIDQHQQLASEFNVSSLPTLMLIKDGQIIDRQTGVADHQRVASLLAR